MGVVVAGCVGFKESLGWDERRLLIDRIKDALELPRDADSIGYGAFSERVEGRIYYFCHVDWRSRLDEERVEALIKEIGDKVMDYEIALYHLNSGVYFFKDSMTGEDVVREI
jgi:hypothetical protein